MIKQKYDYSFFYDNYKYRCDSMFRKYYKKLEEEYRYFIIVKENINEYKSNVYRSNLYIESILRQLRQMTFQVAEIHDKQAKFPDVAEYWYNKVNGIEQIVKIYEDSGSQTRRLYNSDLIFMRYSNYDKIPMSVRLDDRYIVIMYKSYTIYYNLKQDSIEVHKSTPLSAGTYVKYTTDHKELVEKVLNKLMRANVKGFYDELIQLIKEKFQIR